MGPRPRIRDVERTIRLLKEATIEQLVSKGIARLSIQSIVDKAGVSQGALFHHFPTKERLIAAAFEELLKEFADQLRETGAKLRAGSISRAEFVERVAGTMASDMFIGSMEIALAIRSDEAFQELVSQAVVEWRQSLFEFWDSTFEIPGASAEESYAHWSMASNTLRGYAFTSIFGGKAEAHRQLFRGFSKLYLDKATVRKGG